MSLPVLFLLFFGVLVYWVMTQIVPERKKGSLLRRGLSEGLLGSLNDRRRQRGLPLLELDDELTMIAEDKAVHQVMTGRDDEGWEYPADFAYMFGQSLLLEALFTGRIGSIAERIGRQRDMLDGEWIRCGIGVAGNEPGQVVVAIILCREGWEPLPETAHQQSLSTPHP
jgi:hypothetical protein